MSIQQQFEIESAYTKEELENFYMNPYTGTVDTLQDWICSFREYVLIEDKDASFEDALSLLVEVTRDDENDCWKEV